MHLQTGNYSKIDYQYGSYMEVNTVMSGYSQKNKLTTDQHPENMKITWPI